MGEIKTKKQTTDWRTQPMSVAVVDSADDGSVVVWAVDVGREPHMTGAWVLERDDRDTLVGLVRDCWLLPVRFDGFEIPSRGVLDSHHLAHRVQHELKADEAPERYTPPTYGALEATVTGDPRTAFALGAARWLERSALAWYDGRRRKVPLLPVAECLRVAP